MKQFAAEIICNAVNTTKQKQVNVAFVRSSLGVMDLCTLSLVSTDNAVLAVPPSCIRSCKCCSARSRSIAIAKNNRRRESNGNRNGLIATNTWNSTHDSDINDTLNTF